MSEPVTSSKRIAKNTMMLYIRMGISIVIGLYTTRIVLNALGVDDYGIYGVVGGIVVFLGFINGAMSAASSRFLTFELGRKIEGRLEKTFVSAFWVHFAIAVIIVVLAETVGLWFLYNKLVIPYDRMNAALWVYQFSVLTTVVSITQVPYNASIISHEDMDLFAYAEIALCIPASPYLYGVFIRISSILFCLHKSTILSRYTCIMSTVSPMLLS